MPNTMPMLCRGETGEGHADEHHRRRTNRRSWQEQLPRLAVALAVALTLSGCASRTVVLRAADFDDRSEKTLYAALREAGANSDQTRTILTLYDEHHPRLKALSADAETLLTAWRELDRRSAGFKEASDDLAARWSALAGEQMKQESTFEYEVAAVLDEEQWKAWRERWSEAEFDPRGDRLPGGGSRGRRR